MQHFFKLLGGIMEQQYDICFFDQFGELVTVNLNRFQKREITIGRDASSADIVIPFEKISRIHGRFVLNENGVSYQDNDSMNGTIVTDNQRRIELHHTLNMVHATETAFFRIGSDEQFFLFFVRKSQNRRGWKKLALHTKPLNIGRNSSNDVILKHPGVSKRHARVGMRNGEPQVQDLNSHNGTRVNGCNVEGMVTLRDYDVI